MEADDNDSGSTSCCSVTLGTIFCCRPMKNNTRIKVLWAWLLLLSLTSAIVLGCAVYSPFKLLATPSDMIPIQNHVHFLFCEEVNIVSPELQFNGYVMIGDLEIDESKTTHDSQKTALFINERAYEYFAFYLLERSSILFKHCSEDFLTFTVIIGRDNFEIWKKYQYCDDCYFDKRFLHAARSCVDEDNYNEFDLQTVISDEYFIIYSNDNYEDVWLDVNIDLDRTMYNLQNSTTVCTDSIQCDIILDGPGETALIWVMDYNYDLGQYNHPQFSIKCVPRIWAYLLLHGFPVLFIGIFLSILIKKICRNRGRNGFNIQNERTPLLYNSAVLPPSYSAVFLEPPKYEDVIRTCEPPPYCQIAGGETVVNTSRESVNDLTPQTVDNAARETINNATRVTVDDTTREMVNNINVARDNFGVDNAAVQTVDGMNGTSGNIGVETIANTSGETVENSTRVNFSADFIDNTTRGNLYVGSNDNTAQGDLSISNGSVSCDNIQPRQIEHSVINNIDET